MISDEAVEAAYDKFFHLGLSATEIEGILEAAAPYMLRPAQVEAWQAGYDIGCDRTIDAAPNPYED